MDAKELADEFDNRNWTEVDAVLWAEKSAAMLRQQAAEIESLKDKLMLAKQSLQIVEDWVKK
jgi:hypothetical protein